MLDVIVNLGAKRNIRILKVGIKYSANDLICCLSFSLVNGTPSDNITVLA